MDELRRCLVIGNGKSLNDISRELLDKYPTFGSNRIYLLNGFIPTYYAACNPLVIKQYAKEINRMKCEKFIKDKLSSLIPGSTPLYDIGAELFSFRPDAYIYEGYTVTYVLLQLAYWKNFQEVGLVGVDHDYQFKGAPNQLLKAEGEDPNHFSPDYFANGAEWHAPDLAKSERAYRMAETVYNDNNRKIINLTPGTKLDVFQKGDWQSWL